MSDALDFFLKKDDYDMSLNSSPMVFFYYQDMERSRYAEDLARALAASFSKKIAPGHYFEVFMREFQRRDAKRSVVTVNLCKPNESVISSHSQTLMRLASYTTLRKGLFLGFANIRQQLEKKYRQERRLRNLATKANIAGISRSNAQAY